MTTEEAEPCSHPGLRSELLRRVEVDQAVRKDRDRWDEMATVDADNRAWLKPLIRRHGWLGRSAVRRDGANAMWLLVQHSDKDSEFQRQCIGLLRDAVASGDADPTELAYLEDRIRVNAGEPQLYGTQCVKDDSTGQYVPLPLAEPDRVDEHRATVGLGPLEEYVRQVNELNN